MKNIIILSLLLFGCISKSGTENPKKSTEKSTKTPVSLRGCLFSKFYDKTNEKDVVRRKDKKIYAIKTPTGSVATIIKQLKFSVSDFEKNVLSPTKAEGKYGVFSLFFPKATTWKQLKPYLQKEDQIFLFTSSDSGFIVIRSNHLYCMVVTNHRH
jgi:hypothetical protein